MKVISCRFRGSIARTRVAAGATAILMTSVLGALNGKALWRVTFNNPKPQQAEQHELLLTSLDVRMRDVQQGPDGNLSVVTDSGADTAADAPADTAVSSRMVTTTLPAPPGSASSFSTTSTGTDAGSAYAAIALRCSGSCDFL